MDDKYQTAFPCEVVTVRASGAVQRIETPGMSLRDYFAAAAMQGITSGRGSNEYWPYSSIAELAYKMADAMITERDEK